MAKQTLPVNFKDDILASSMGGKRKYRIIDNGDGIYSFEDVTEYTQTGSDFGAGQINATNKAVNDSCDKADVIDSLDDIVANQANGKIAGAKAVKAISEIESAELRNNFNTLFGYATRRGKQVSITSVFASNQWTYQAADWVTIGTLPTSMRPPRQQNGMAVYGNAQDHVTGFRVTTNGQVQAYFPVGSGQYMSFSMSYSID